MFAVVLSCGEGRVVRYLQGGEVVGGAGGDCGSRCQCTRVGCQQRQPGREVGRVVGVGRAREPEVGQYEGGAELGHEFLGGVGAGSEPAGEVAGEAVGGAGPVHEFVGERAGMARGRAEGGARRQVDRVSGREVAGAVAALVDLRAGRGDKGVEGRQ